MTTLRPKPVGVPVGKVLIGVETGQLNPEDTFLKLKELGFQPVLQFIAHPEGFIPFFNVYEGKNSTEDLTDSESVIWHTLVEIFPDDAVRCWHGVAPSLVAA